MSRSNLPSRSLLRPNVALRLKSRLAVHRRIALGTWSPPDDPTVHGTLKLPADPMLDYLEAVQCETGRKVTLITAVAKAFAIVFREVPDANVIVRWGRIYLRDDVDVFVHVALTDPQTGKPDLSGATLRNVDQHNLVELATSLEEAVGKVRADKDPAMAETRTRMRQMPQFLVRGALRGISFLSYTLNLDPTAIGAPRDPFGSVGITNVGSLGLDTAYVPLVPYTRLPLFIALGAVQREPVVHTDDNGQESVVIESRVALHATFDHRVLDGAHLAKMAGILRRIFADPTVALGPPGSPSR